jgi:putative tributyrin esterase
MGEFFALSAKREDNWVAGLSMGGYGALSLGLSRPDVFSAIGCFSAGNMNLWANRPARPRKSGKASRDMTVFGVEDRKELFGDINFDCFTKAEAAIQKGRPLPRIFHCVGDKDFLNENAHATADWFKAHPQYDYSFREGPGAHTWEFWDEWVQRFLAWLLPGKF